jgi:hypothetical protein
MRLRAKAAEIREMARKVTDPELRRHFDIEAAAFDRLADYVEAASERDEDDAPGWRTRR